MTSKFDLLPQLMLITTVTCQSSHSSYHDCLRVSIRDRLPHVIIHWARHGIELKSIVDRYSQLAAFQTWLRLSVKRIVKRYLSPSRKEQGSWRKEHRERASPATEFVNRDIATLSGIRLFDPDQGNLLPSPGLE
ncbi:uncharacterized protein BDV17DRAFT_68512 [Aspergillus undulatus]|uniref:uncharacterized protein n=1 Tax=Aspergillus undulatus TaxID=1810928 RepID=UPI003CCD55BF